MTYNDQKQTYVFVENNALVPLENNIYIIFPKPTKRSFQYNQKTMQFKQIRLDVFEWSTRHLLHQDVILHEEEYIQFRKQRNQIEDNTPTKYYVDSMGPQSIPEQDILAGDSRLKKRTVEFNQNTVGTLIKKN